MMTYNFRSLKQNFQIFKFQNFKYSFHFNCTLAKEFFNKNIENTNIFPKHISHFINGEFINMVKTKDAELISVINPSTEDNICTFPEAGEYEVDLAVNAASSAFAEWNSMPYDIRVRLFMRLAEKVEENILMLSLIESIDNGKSLKTAYEDIIEVVRLIRYYGGFIDKLSGNTISAIDDFTIQTRRIPFGVVGCISPWNYPLLMAAWKIIPALCAGNSVILKPSEETPLSIIKFCEIFSQLEFPKGLLNVVLGRGSKTGNLITQNKNISKISFTGSTAAGRQIMISCAESNLKSLQLELGGKSPLVIFEDADIENAVDWIINGAFFNSAQNCICSSRILINEKIYDLLVDKITAKAEKLKIGKYDEPTTDIGPLINKKQYDNYFKFMNIAKKEGLNLIYGGKNLKVEFPKGFFVDPAIYTNVPDTSALATQEIFAPILSILKPFKTAEEALYRANNSQYGLAAGVFSTDLNKIEYFVRNFQSGNLFVNCYNISPYNVPFGGMKNSGFGRDCGIEGIMEFTQTKSVYYYTDFKKI